MIHMWRLVLLISSIRISLASPLESDYALLSPRAAVFDCDIFTAGTDKQYSLQCTQYEQKGYPKTIAGSEVHIYHYTDGWKATGLSKISAISAAIGKTLPLYEKFGHKYDLTVVLDNKLTDQGDTWSPANEPCYMWISTDTSIKATVAHEGYHCVQYANRGDWNNDFNGWWAEGTAEFYGNLFEPDHSDGSFARNYEYDRPLWAENQDTKGSDTALFWIFLNGYGWTYSMINNLVFNEPNAASTEEARSALSSHPSLAKAFPAFAKAYLDNVIKFPDGSLVDPLTKITPLKLEHFSLPDCGSKTKSVNAKTWTIDAFALTLESGQSFTMAWKSSQALASLYYRKATGGDWTDITSSSATIALTCEDDPAHFDFIFTCTADAVTCSGSLTLTQISSLECSSGTPSTSCSSSPSPAGICPYGSWQLTAASYENFIKASTPKGTTVSDIDVSGSASFSLDKTTKKATIQFKSFTGSFTDTDGDSVVHYDLAINGGGTATAVFASDGKSFKLGSPTYTGKFSSQTTFAGGDPQGPDGAFSLGFGSDVEILWACGSPGKDMSLNGQSDGTFIYSLGDFEPVSS